MLQKFVGRQEWQLALRELYVHLRSTSFLAIALGAALILTIIAPFGSGERLPFLPRVLYWLVLGGMTYSIGFLTQRMLRSRNAQMASWQSHVINSLIMALMITPVTIVLTLFSFGIWGNRDEFIRLIFMIFVLAFVTSMVILVVMQNIAQTKPAPNADKSNLLARLSPANRGTLISLHAQDHYVEVTTSKGSELILIRFTDAIDEVGDIEGIRIHRSHWVATQEIAKAERRDGAIQVTMKNGKIIPASRQNAKLLKQLGFLEKS